VSDDGHAAGVDVIDIAPIFLSERHEDVEPTIDRLVALRG